MMLGKHNTEVANASGRIKKNISNPLACRIVDSPHVVRDSDTLAGEFRRGTTILITDLMFRVGTQSGCHDMGMGLADMGWSIELFKIHESEAERPIEQFFETMEHVTEYLSQVADEGNITVHIWLSLQFLHAKRPPHYVMLENTFMTQFIKAVLDLDQLISRPVIIAINNDSMFNCIDSITSRTAVEMTERLKAQGVMVTTDQRMWRSMYSQFGKQFPILNTTRKGSLGKTAIWSVIEKNLFRQRVFLMCATNREYVSALNEGAYKPDQSGIDPALLREVTGPTHVFKIASGEMTPEDYAAADATVFQKGPPDGAPTTRFNKDKRYKAQWVEPMVPIHELEPSPISTCYWFPVFSDSMHFLCDSCRRAQTMDEIEMNQSRPATCINCSANTQDHYKKSAPTLGARKSVLMLAARLKVAFANCDRNEIFAHTRASAEKVGNIIEFWLGVLDVANMTKGLVDVFDVNTDPADFLNGLEKALRGCGSVSRTTSTINDKRRGSFDCTLQPAEAEEVLRILNGIPDYESLRDFNCMTDLEAAFVIQEFHKKKGISGDDVDMGDDAEAQPGLGSTTHPGEADAEEPQDDFADAARESERSGKQQLLDALGNLFAVSESVNVCIFCGSTKHDHADCTDPKET